MRKLLMVVVAAAFTAVLVGCSSIPQNLNMSGKWNYQYGKEPKTGSMELMQAGSKLAGTSNDAEGQFAVDGTVLGAKLVLYGKCAKSKRTYTINAELDDENNFEGTYTTNAGTFGKIKGQRQ